MHPRPHYHYDYLFVSHEKTADKGKTIKSRRYSFLCTETVLLDRYTGLQGHCDICTKCQQRDRREERTYRGWLLSETEHTNNFQDVYPTESCSKPMLNIFVNRAAKTVRTCWHETAGRTFHPYLSTTNHVPPPRASQVIPLCHMRLVLKLDIARGGAASRKINKINTQKPSTFYRFRC